MRSLIYSGSIGESPRCYSRCDPALTSDLESWAGVIDGANGATMNRIDDGYGPGIDRIDVVVPRPDEGWFFMRVGAP